MTAWDETTDRIVIYDNTLSSTITQFRDATVLPSPRGVFQKANGNILVTDVSYHYLIELAYDPDAGTLTFVRNLGGGVLNYPYQVIEIPVLTLE